MKKIIFIPSILSLCFIPLLFFITSIMSTDPCGTCPPPNACTIVCNETNSSLSTSTQDYFNLILTQRTDVRIIMQPSFFTDYNLIMIKDKEICPSETLYTCYKNLGPGSSEQCGPYNLPAGTYYIMVKYKVGPGTYDIDVTCGRYCGNGILDSWFDEECDYAASYDDADGRCQHYQYCNSTCRCHDLRPEARGCDLYDYCMDGMNPSNINEPCCVNGVGSPEGCCLKNSIPAINCSDAGYIRNPDVNASYDFCHIEGYEIDVTNTCIDWDYLNHTTRSNCGVST